MRQANNAEDKVRRLQVKLYQAAKHSPARRFHALYDKVYAAAPYSRELEDGALHHQELLVRRRGLPRVEGPVGGVQEIRAFHAALGAQLRATEGELELAVRRHVK
jgi:hypothetical protein